MSTTKREQIKALNTKIREIEKELHQLRKEDAEERAPLKPGDRVKWCGREGVVIEAIWQEDDPKPGNGYRSWEYKVDRQFKNGKTKTEKVWSWEEIEKI